MRYVQDKQLAITATFIKTLVIVPYYPGSGNQGDLTDVKDLKGVDTSKVVILCGNHHYWK